MFFATTAVDALHAHFAVTHIVEVNGVLAGAAAEIHIVVAIYKRIWEVGHRFGEADKQFGSELVGSVVVVNIVVEVVDVQFLTFYVHSGDEEF